MQKKEHWRQLLMRTEETAKAYEEAQQNMTPDSGCRLCNDPETFVEYEHWRLVPNRFPYDRYFTKSDMLITKRHTDETGLDQPEKAELVKLKSGPLSDEYDLIFENLPKQKSIPHHIHYHLVQIKRADQ
jgi:hypothetical protein